MTAAQDWFTFTEPDDPAVQARRAIATRAAAARFHRTTIAYSKNPEHVAAATAALADLVAEYPELAETAR